MCTSRASMRAHRRARRCGSSELIGSASSGSSASASCLTRPMQLITTVGRTAANSSVRAVKISDIDPADDAFVQHRGLPLQRRIGAPDPATASSPCSAQPAQHNVAEHATCSEDEDLRRWFHELVLLVSPGGSAPASGRLQHQRSSRVRGAPSRPDRSGGQSSVGHSRRGARESCRPSLAGGERLRPAPRHPPQGC